MSQYSDHVLDCLQPFGDIRCRRMFGGYGFFREGLMFALLANEDLYMKAHDESAKIYQALGSEPFTFMKHGKPVVMSYWKLPPDMLENLEALERYVEISCEAARAAATKKSKRAKRTKPQANRGG